MWCVTCVQYSKKSGRKTRAPRGTFLIRTAIIERLLGFICENLLEGKVEFENLFPAPSIIQTGIADHTEELSLQDLILLAVRGGLLQ